MRITLTDDAGTVLDWATISPEDFIAEVKRNPAGILAQLQPGDEALARPSRWLVVTSRNYNGSQLEPYLYGSSTIVASWELQRAAGQDVRLVIVQVVGATETDAAVHGEQQADRFSSGLHTVWTVAGTREQALAETVVVRATLGASSS